jgi:hypothetical protein
VSVVITARRRRDPGGQRGSKDEGVAGVAVGGERGRVGGRPRDGIDGYLGGRKWRVTHRGHRVASDEDGALTDPTLRSRRERPPGVRWWGVASRT